MGRPAINHLGKRFGRLTVISRAETANGQARWNCACDCGGVTVVAGGNLTNGKTNSCGCLSSYSMQHSHRKHGYVYTQIYYVWSGMLRRCLNGADPAWKYYGGRGITVCKRWRKFENFLADMGEKPVGAPVSITERGIGYGVALGFDWQMPGTPIVLGIAADHTWTDAMAIEKHWSVIGRGGVVIGNAMPYALVGFKKADVLGTDLDGWMAGGGIEFALGRGLYMGGEYRFTAFDLPSWVPAGIDGMQHELRATLKYKANFF